jgi:hypothetical protein
MMLDIITSPEALIAAMAVVSALAGYGLRWLLSPVSDDELAEELEVEVKRLRAECLRTACERDAAERLYAEIKATSVRRDPVTGRLVKRGEATA